MQMMYNEQNIRKSETGINLEIGNLTKCALIITSSFIASAAMTSAIKHLFHFQNNLAATLLLASALFASSFLAMRVDRTFVKEHIQRYSWLVIPPALAAIFLVSSLKPVVFSVLFMLHGLVCVFLKELKNTARLGIELTMLITILGSFVYGPKTGALLGAAAMLMEYVLAARLSYFAPVTTISYALIGLFAGNLSSAGITIIGITATVIYNIITSFIIVAFMGGQLDKCLRFGLSNIALNVVLFNTIAPWLLSITR